jgi:Zn-dependent M28 family amino/carboxypeptidase
MEAARIFAGPDVQTEYSIRFILWNCEEIGRGARAYVLERWDKQGVEDPPGSGRHPEPKWLGMIQHDMMLFDHGMPAARGERPSENQDPRADVDIEYQARGTFGGKALELAAKLFVANAQYATDYPAEIGQNMSNTDSSAFINYCPAISLRENQRIAEIGRGADPQWHKNSDVYETYSDADFRLGFAAAQTTTAAIAELAGARIR